MKEGIVISPCPIAIVGVGTLFPGSQNPFGFWRDILLERDLITEVPPEYWLVEDVYDPDPRALDRTYAKRGAFFREPVIFDCMEFGILPKSVEQIDVTQLLALWVAKQAFEDATDKDLSKLDRERTGVFVGVSGALEIVTEQSIRMGRLQLVKSLRELGYTEDKVQAIVERFLAHSNVPNEAAFPGGLANVVAGRIANHFDLKGSNCTTDAACASSLAAIKTAMMELWLGEADCCLAGGADTLTGPFPFTCFSKTPALSFSGEIRPFSADADGTLLGEGICFFVLKRLADAERDGDKIYAVIQGIGSSSDGSGTAIYAPKQEGQILALKRAYAKAGYGPETVELLEAHGTGTRAGDVVEFKAATRVFREADPQRKQWCALGSVKSQIGHTKGTAGAASLFKATMALHHQALPPTLKVTRPNPEFHIEESPFYLNTRTRPWFHVAPYPRRAGVSAFGFGGSNFHVTVEEYHGSGKKPLRFRPAPTELLLASGQSIEAIHQQVKALLDGRDNDDGFRFACRQSQLAFNVDDPVRLGLVAESSEKALEKLASFIKTIEKTPEKDHFLPQMFYAHGHKTGKIAFLFPGQGSQYLYMGSDLAIAFPEARIPWEKARELCLSPEMPLDEIAIPKPAFTEEAIQAQTQRLTETQNAQPAIGLVSAGMLHILEKLGVTADMAAGHSFGELAALYAAGVFSEASFLQAARKRGELMAKAAATPGAMVAVFAPQPAILQLLGTLDLPITVANFNAPLQTVLSGDMEAIALLEKELSNRKMEFRRLPVATAFHSPLVESAVLPFEEFLQGIACQAPSLPVYANTTAQAYPKNAQEIKTILARQLANPVRFVESIEAMYNDGARFFIEVGPGQVLSQLAREILKGKESTIVHLDQKGQHGLSSLWQGLGQLAVSGLAINWPALWEGIAPFDDPRARKKPKVAVELYGYNYNRPYPPKGGAAALPKPNPPQVTPIVPPAKEAIAAPAKAEVSAPAKGKTESMASKAPNTLHAEEPLLKSQEKTTPSIMVTDRTPISEMQDIDIPSEETPLWLSVIRDMQRQTTSTHQQFLHLAERSLQTLESAILGGHVSSDASARREQPAQRAGHTPPVATEHSRAPSPMPYEAQQSVAMPAEQKLQESERAKPQPAAQPATVSPAPSVQPPAVTPTSTVTQPVASAAPTMTPEEFLKILLDVVADKTGYPLDLLEPTMDIETDLGIDSIKRVEILSALQEKIPNLPEVDLTKVAALRTLGEIASYIEQHGRQLSESVAEQASTQAVTPTSTVTQPAAPTMTPEEFLNILLDVVADKTGYPLDLLEPTMDIETDLGIDSIKRVEILSALQEKIPNLPEVDLTEVAALRTLGEIASYIEQHGSEVAAQASAQPDVTSTVAMAQPLAPATPTMTPEEFLNILLDVVADKTGYPLDLLEPTMDIETDLGIDSIKRVEILSALQEKIPNLPEVDLTKVAALRTLGEIASYIEQHGKQLSESVAEQAPVTEASSEGSRKDSGIRRFVVEPTAMPLSTFVLPRLLDQQTVYVTPDTRGVAQALADALQERGIACSITRDVPQTATIVICLEGLNEPSSIEEALAMQQEAFIRLTKLAPTFEKDGGTLVIVQDTAGTFGRSGLVGNRAWLGGLTGLAKTAYLEWPKASVRALDLDTAGKSTKAIVDALLHEFFYGGSDVEVGVAGDTRVRLGLVQKELDQTLSPRLGSDDVVVATGGARGVTAACMIELAKSSQAKMVLLGRTALEDEPAFCADARDEAALKKAFLDEARAKGKNITPAILSKKAAHILGMREIQATLQAIRAAGSEVIYENCDVADQESLNMALAKARQAFGSITAIVHGAGVLADKKLGDKTAEHFQQVFAPKVVGLQNLLQATRDDPIKAMVFFSSVAGRFGNMGQADYAMANEILARVAFEEKRNRPGCLVKSIAWGPWEGGMVSPMLKELFTKFGVAVIPIAEGARRFVEEIQWGDEESPEVLIGGGEPKISPTSAMGNAPERRFDILVEKQRQPYLTSHIIHGRVVAPSVIAIEYALRAGRSLTPHLQPYLLQDLKIIRGLTWSLSEFDRERTILVMTLKEDLENPNVIYATLKDQRGLLRYSGTLVMSENPKVPEGPTFSDSLPVQIGPDEIYDGKAIFHGPDFYAITSITGMDEKCIQGNLVGGVDLHWPQEDWVIDPPLLDGALQLSHIWGRKIRNIFVLPSACSAIYVYQRGLRQGRMRCEVAIVRANNLSLKGNLSITDQEGQMVMAVEGLEGFVVPSEAIAQLENTGQQLKTGGE